MKGDLKIFILLSIFLILGLSFVSAGLISNIWVRTTGNTIINDCTQSCYSLGYQCGTAKICGQAVNCGSCATGKTCSSGKCVKSSLSFEVLDNCKNQNGLICENHQVCDGIILKNASDSNRCCKGNCVLPKNFDWRDKHGKNWNSPVKNQGEVASCTSFSAFGAIEAAINLYFNQHLDVNLAEQVVSSCSDEYYATCIFNKSIIPNPGWPKICQYDSTGFPIWQNSSAGNCFGVNAPAIYICKSVFVGIPDEGCIPYVNNRSIHFGYCNERICSDYAQRLWKVFSFGQLLPEDNIIADWALEEYPDLNQELMTEENLKKKIILNGPVAVAELISGHSILVVGWNGDKWIYKDSYGDYPPEAGYSYVVGNLSKATAGFVEYPVFSPMNKSYWPARFFNRIICVDNDKDTFCNWGISKDKPSTCPTFCKSEKDWDDSNPIIGALAQYSETICGNGILEIGEECDEGNLLNGDGCSKFCQTEVVQICRDSDGGLNFYKYGNISGPDEDEEGNPSTDYCWPDRKGLMEGYCNSRGYVDFYSYNCTPENKICFNGACIVPSKCVDSDGGLNYYTKGTVTYTYGGLSLIPNDKAVVDDYCSGSSVNEVYCYIDANNVSQIGWKGATCKYGCLNGACKKLLGIFR